MEVDNEEVKSFKDLGVCEQLVEACDNLDWKNPSKIQAEAIPHALEGKDLIGLAQTGSSKTGAFVLPILQSLLETPQAFFACVLSPTRELAIHIAEQFEALGSGIGVKCAVLVGGVDQVQQSIALGKRPHIVAAQPEPITLEKALKAAMVPAGTAREADFGREVPLFEVEATAVEPGFQKLYSYIFDTESGRYSAEEMDRPLLSAIFVVNFDKVRMDPRNKDIDLDSLMYGRVNQLTEEEMKGQEGGYIYRYRYNGGGASQVWLGSGSFAAASGYDNGPVHWGEYSNYVNANSLPIVPSAMYSDNPSLLLHPGYGFDSQVAYGQFSPLASTLSRIIVDGQLYSPHQVPVSPTYCPQPVSLGMPRVTSRFPISQTGLRTQGSSGQEGLNDNVLFGPGPGYYVHFGSFDGGNISRNCSPGFYKFQGELGSGKLGSGKPWPNQSNASDMGNYWCPLTS